MRGEGGGELSFEVTTLFYQSMSRKTFPRCLLLLLRWRVLFRHGIPALKPAPIVASYLGYPGTVGSDYTDYAIVDSVSETATLF